MNGSLTIAVTDFLAHKRALGRKYLAEEATLRLLLVFSEQQGLTELDELTTVLLDASSHRDSELERAASTTS